MIKELAISATLVAILASLPYLFSPLQVAIGSFADRHPLMGRRRTPYIVLGLLLCVAGVILAPQAAFIISTRPGTGILVGLRFGAWGMGYNLASVSIYHWRPSYPGKRVGDDCRDVLRDDYQYYHHSHHAKPFGRPYTAGGWPGPSDGGSGLSWVFGYRGLEARSEPSAAGGEYYPGGHVPGDLGEPPGNLSSCICDPAGCCSGQDILLEPLLARLSA
jgi:hypothetical protein